MDNQKLNERYLFRGMRKGSPNEFIYGDLNHVEEGVYVFDRSDDTPLNSPDWYEVFPETVGMWSGLTDKNGVKIFSGDKVQNGLSGTWIVQPLERGSFSLLGICEQYRGRNFDISALNQNVEVIGTIYDKLK